jgi:phosphatidylinositol alpha-1,6-mannosyltransferase
MLPRPSVWVVTPELHRRGGTERCLAEQVQRWKDRSLVRLYTMRAEGVDLSGVELRRIPRPPGPHLVRYLWWLAANRVVRWRDVRRLGPPDVLHSPGVNCLDAEAVSAHFVAASHWEAIRSRVHQDLRRPSAAIRAVHRVLQGALLRRLEARVYAGPATLWAHSRRQARDLEARFGRPAGSVQVVPHGVDTHHFSPVGREARRPAARSRLRVEGRRILLLVGNDAHNKGVDTAIAALRRLPPDVTLAIAGGADRALVRPWARGVEDRVLLWPHTEDIRDYYAAADALIAPSREDSFNAPVMEALASGLPVVVSAAAGASELVEDGRDALVLADPGDATGLARLTAAILDDRRSSQRLARRGRRLAERHSWEENAATAEALLLREAETPRVLVLTPDPAGTGGIQRATRTLLGSFAELMGPERVGVLALRSHSGEGALPCRILRGGRPANAAGVRISMPERVGFAAATLLAAWRWRARLVVVCAHPSLAPVARAARAITGRPYAVWCHGEEVWGRISPLVAGALRGANVVFAPSRFTAAQVEARAGLSPGSVRIVPHPLPPEVRPAPVARARRRPRVLTVARLAPEHTYKGIDTLLAAWPKVRDRVGDAELVVVGGGPDGPRLRREATRLRVDGSVRFVGPVSDEELARLYCSSAVLALPSRARVGARPAGEGFGLVFLEAAAAGLPVVAGATGAVPEVVQGSRTGLLVDPDNPREVAQAIAELLLDPERARRMGEEGRRHVTRQHSYEGFRAWVAGLIGELAPARPRSPTVRPA